MYECMYVYPCAVIRGDQKRASDFLEFGTV